MAGRSVEVFPKLEKYMSFDITQNEAGPPDITSIGVGLFLKGVSPVSSVRAARGCEACAFHADSYGAGGEVGPLRAACSGFRISDGIAALRIVPKREKTFPRPIDSLSLTVSAAPPCGVDLPDIVRNALKLHTKGK